MAPHVTESLSAYMDDELAAPEREAVAAHLRGCPACARHLEELLAVDAASRELPLAVPDGYFEAFRGSLRRRLEGSRPAPRRLAPAWALAAAAAVVLAVLTPRLLREPRAPADSAARGVPAPTPAAPPATAPPGHTGAADAVAESPRREPPSPMQSAGARLERRNEARRPQAVPPAAPPAVPLPGPAAKAATPAAPAETAGEKEADELRALGYAGAPARDRFAQTPEDGKAAAETSAAGHAEEARTRRDKAAIGALQDRAAPAGEGRFELLARRTISSAADARSARAAWRAFARDEGAGPRADEARVRAIEAGVEAWRRGRDEKDRDETRDEGRAYLARPDALQRDRVRAALKSLEP